MTAPLVSICLPNLNTMAYLPERVETIRRQTYGNWELIVSDNHSEDGAWPFFQALARVDSRVSIAQAPREGMYANWNRCIERAHGDFIYVATSDDTMPVDCLEKLVAALNANPGCDLAHCPLRAIDERGDDIAETRNWWLESSAFARSSGPLLNSLHVRRAPFDGLLHLLGDSVYVSITQLLIRRRLFDRIGGFETRWGSVGDFNWNMRAAMVGNTVHVPDTWGGWRIHPHQATATIGMGSSEHVRKMEEMIAHAVDTTSAFVPPVMRRQLATKWVLEAKEWRKFLRGVDARAANTTRRRAFVIARALACSAPAREYVKSSLFGGDPVDWVRRCLDESEHGPALVPANRSASTTSDVDSQRPALATGH